MKNNETYLGNRNLKRSNVIINFTPDQVQEYIKCARDPVHFIKNYIRIVNVDTGLVPFILRDYQEDMVRLAVYERFVICKMPRQVGKSITIAALLLWYVLFNEDYSIAILANKERQAREILGRIQLAYEHLPKWLQQGILEWNKGNIELENGSKILASSTSGDAIRGTSQNLIYLDEFAFVPNNMQESFFASVYPTISSGKTTKVLITSTPNGMNLFYKLWVDSEEGRNSYKRIDIHWSQVPGRDEKWKEETIRNTSEYQFRVEYECEFLGSTNTLIDGSFLRKMVYKNPINQSNDINIYLSPAQNRLYIIVVDTARGTNNDYSAFQVFDVTEFPYRLAATYRNNSVTSYLYPNMIHAAARSYNNAYVLVETNDVGQQVADILYNDLEYENMMFTHSSAEQGPIISQGNRQSVLGVRTTKLVKKVGCSNLKTLIESNKLIIEDLDTIQELVRFVALPNGSYEAEQGNDDLVMCCVLFAWLTNQQYFKDVTNQSLREVLFNENVKQIEEDVLPFGIVDDGSGEVSDNVLFKEIMENNKDSWIFEAAKNTKELNL
jgi:hypothetical protein